MTAHRKVEEIAEDIVETCSWRKMTQSPPYLVDFAPLVVVMARLAAIIEERGGSFDKPKARKVWSEAVKMAQDDNYDSLEHNRWIPCRSCDKSFEPIIDDTLLSLFLAWYKHMSTQNLLAIHRCPACGGSLKAKRTKHYDGDYHTPAPGSVDNDEAWGGNLLEHHGF